jgi:hypothetical protein
MRAAVASHVQQPPREPVLAGQSRHVWVAERASGGYHARCMEDLPGGGAHDEPGPVVRFDRGHRRAGPDVGAEAGRVPAQIAGHLVAVRVVIGIAGKA